MFGDVKKRFGKKAQQSSFGMSFGMLFSIFLIVVFIAAAFMVINAFLKIGGDFGYGEFYVDLQEEVNRAWRSTDTVRYMDLDLPKKITHICFANLSAEITGNEDIYDDYLEDYQYDDVNVFLIPPGVAGNLDRNKIRHLDMAKITVTGNPYCIKNPNEMTIIKGVRSKYVSIE